MQISMPSQTWSVKVCYGYASSPQHLTLLSTNARTFWFGRIVCAKPLSQCDTCWWLDEADAGAQCNNT
jgi:hypothetical protein